MMERENNFTPLFFSLVEKLRRYISPQEPVWVQMCKKHLGACEVFVCFGLFSVCLYVCVHVCGLECCGGFSRSAPTVTFTHLPEWEHTCRHTHSGSYSAGSFQHFTITLGFWDKLRYGMLLTRPLFSISVAGIWTRTTSPGSLKWTSPASRTSGFCKLVSFLSPLCHAAVLQYKHWAC